MPPFVETILFVFLLIVLGYFLIAARLIKPETGDALSDFVFTAAVPALLFRTLLGADFSEGAPWGLWITYFTAVAVTWTAGHVFIRRVAGRDVRAGVVAGLTSAFSNLVLLGLPLIDGVFGPEGLLALSLIVSIHLVIMMAASMALFEWAVRRDGVVKAPPGIARLAADFARQLLRNPLILGILAGLAGRFSGLTLPSLAERLVDSLAGIAGPLALIAMGMSLRRFGVKGHIGPACGLAAFKLFLMPAVALLVAWTIGMPPLQAKVVVVAAALPCGVNAWLIAARFDTGQRLASTAMTIATAAAVGSTLFWVFVADAVFG